MSDIILATLDDNIIKTPNCGNHISTDWQFSEFPDFSVITSESLDDTENLYTYVYNGPLYLNQAGDREGIYIRSRFKTENFTTNWNNGIYHYRDIVSGAIEKPTLNTFNSLQGNVQRWFFTSSYSLGSTNSIAFTGKTLVQEEIVLNPFVATGGLTHTATRWKIYEEGSLNRPLEFTTQDPFLTSIDLIANYNLYNFDTGIPYRLKMNTFYILEVTFISNGIESPTGVFRLISCGCEFLATSATSGILAPRSVNPYIDTNKLTCATSMTPRSSGSETTTQTPDSSTVACTSSTTSTFLTDIVED